jgi:hypothetical protein
MAQLPSISSARVGLDTTGTVTQSIGQAQQLGQGIADFGGQLQAAQQRSDERDAVAYTSKAFSEFQLSESQKLAQDKTSGISPYGYTKAYSDGYEERSKALLENAPNAIAKEHIQERINAGRVSFVGQAIDFEANEKTKLQKQAYAETVGNYANMAANDPSKISELIAQLDGDAAAGHATGTLSDRKAFTSDAKAKIYSAAIMGEMERNPANAREMLNQNAGNMPYDQVIRMNDRIDKKEEAIQRQQDKIDGLQGTDPALWVAITQGELPPEESVAVQAMAGIPESKISLLPNEVAKDAVDRLNSIQTPEEYTLTMQQLHEKYGNNSDIIMRDLKKGGLSEGANFASFFDPVSDNEAMKAHFEVLKNGEKTIRENATTTMAAKGDKFSDLNTAVAENLSDFMNVQVAAGMPATAINEINGAALNMASVFYAKGGSIEDAAERATKWLNDKYVIEDVGIGKVAIPNIPELKAGNIVDELENKLETFDGKDVELQFDDKHKRRYTSPEVYAKFISKMGGFINNNTGDGAYLIDNNGMIVFDKSLNPIEYKFYDLQKSYEARRIQEKKTTDANNQINAVMTGD